MGAAREETGCIANFLNAERGASYDVGGLLARGGMGSIHKAIDRSCKRTVAMKLLHASKERDAQDIGNRVILLESCTHDEIFSHCWSSNLNVYIYIYI